MVREANDPSGRLPCPSGWHQIMPLGEPESSCPRVGPACFSNCLPVLPPQITFKCHQQSSYSDKLYPWFNPCDVAWTWYQEKMDNMKDMHPAIMCILEMCALAIESCLGTRNKRGCQILLNLNCILNRFVCIKSGMLWGIYGNNYNCSTHHHAYISATLWNRLRTLTCLYQYGIN